MSFHGYRLGEFGSRLVLSARLNKDYSGQCIIVVDEEPKTSRRVCEAFMVEYGRCLAEAVVFSRGVRDFPDLPWA
jgi:hypothetical protein